MKKQEIAEKIKNSTSSIISREDLVGLLKQIKSESMKDKMILSIFEAIENLDDNSVEYDDDYEFQLEGKNVYLDKSSIQIDVDSFREYVLNDIKGALDDCAEELIQDLQQEEKEEC